MFRQRTQTEEKRKPREERKSKDEITRKSGRSENPVIRYFQETSVELRKVAWPTREQAIRLTLICLGAIVVFALFFGVLDILFQRLASLLVTL